MVIILNCYKHYSRLELSGLSLDTFFEIIQYYDVVGLGTMFCA